MRLRLVIRRNGLPDSHILWSSAGLNSTLSSNNKKITIAEFLHEVDYVIPLESEDWGVEDYVVEVGGFECVHFSALENVLKEDDEVVIRPLALNDRRFRRVSGRVQIAADGRRLYDGIAFGRPFLRKAPRPSIRIPSIKRARMSYDDEYQFEPVAPNQLVLRDEDSGDEDEAEYHNELSAEEIADLAAEEVAFENKRSSFARNDSRKRRRAGLGIQAVQASPPEVRQNPSSKLRRRSRKESLGESPKSVRFESEGVDTPATIIDMNDSEDSEDEDFDASENDSDTDDSEANKENIAPTRSDHASLVRRSSRISDRPPADSDETTSDSESTSSSCDSSSDTDSTSTFDSSDENSDGEGSVSQSASEPTTPEKSAKQKRDVKTRDSSSMLTQGITSKQVPPGEGLLKTRKRNARRRLRKKFNRASSANILPEPGHEVDEAAADQAPLDDQCQPSQQDDINSIENRVTMSSRRLNTVVDSQTAFDKDNTAVSENLDIAMEPQNPMSETSSPPQEESSKVDQSRLQDTNGIHSTRQQLIHASHEEPTIRSNHETPKRQQASSRRTKLDLGGANRMLFNSLGLRAPRTKNEADKLREELKAKAQKLPGNMLGPVKPVQDPTVAEPETFDEVHDESWRDKIDLSAVECCYDGVTYSQPPFPFIQRWDPQQQYQYVNGKKGRGGRNKRKNRNSQQYYQDGHTKGGYLTYDGTDEQQYHQDQDANMEDVISDPHTGADHVQQTNLDSRAANDQLLEEMQAEVNAAKAHSDLPDLPVDMSTLDALSIDNALSGSVIAFKQMEMSEHTQWCPVISEYKTARIEAVLDKDILDVLLAARDVLHKQKNYDPKTGERIFSKFEIPIDEDEEADDRRLEIALQDMIEPKLVKAAEVSDLPPDLPVTIEVAFESEQQSKISKREDTNITETTTKFAAGAVDINLQGVKTEPMISTTPDSVRKATSKKNGPLLEAKNSQSPMPTEAILPHLRFASVELGSLNPPNRFFSEPQDDPIPDPVDAAAILFPETNQPSQGHTTEENRHDTSSTALKVDDPSIWGPATENDEQEESSRYYSLSTERMGDRSSSALPAVKDSETNGKEAISNEDHSENLDYPAIQSGNNDIAPSPNMSRDGEFETPLFADDGDEELPAANFDENSVDDESEEPTFLQADSSSKDKSHVKNGSVNMDDDWDSGDDSSSLPSLRDLISESAPDLTRSGTKKNKKNKYPKISPTAHEDVDMFVFSQAPKRLITDTHKVAVDLETNSFVGSSYAELPAEPYELEAHVTDTGAHELEDIEPQLPPISNLDRSSKSTPTNKRNQNIPPAFQKPPKPTHRDSSKSNTASIVVDLTLSSDGIEPVDESSRVKWSVASSMPSASSKVGNIGGSLRAKSKPESKSSKRSLKRTKSLV